MHHAPSLRSLWLSLIVLAPLAAADAREPVPIGGKRFIGEISLIPSKGIGLWRIASRQVISDSMTEIVAMRAPIQIGTCVQVDMRLDKVLKIETLRPDEC